MVSTPVHFQFCLLDEGLLAIQAREGTFPCMAVHVVLKADFLGEGFVAQTALERALSRMGPFMSLEIGRKECRIRTIRTAVASWRPLNASPKSCF